MEDKDRKQNLNTVMEVIEDLFEDKGEYSHMTGDIILSSRTADEVLQKIIDKRDGRK